MRLCKYRIPTWLPTRIAADIPRNIMSVKCCRYIIIAVTCRHLLVNRCVGGGVVLWVRPTTNILCKHVTAECRSRRGTVEENDATVGALDKINYSTARVHYNRVILSKHLIWKGINNIKALFINCG